MRPREIKSITGREGHVAVRGEVAEGGGRGIVGWIAGIESRDEEEG